MKRMRSFLSILCTLLCVLLCASAFAAPRMPELRGIVTDDANVLTVDAVALFTEAAETLEAAYHLKLRLVIVHFLDGVPVQRYTDELFTLRQADEETLLLLCAAGEDCCALHYGSKVSSMLGASNLDRLLSDSGMVSQWQTQRYDQSVYSYLQSLLELCKRQNGGQTVYTLPTPAVPQVNVTSQFDANGVWNGLSATEAASDTWNSLHESAEQAAQRETEEKSSGGLSFGEWLVLIVLVLIVFSQSNPLRRARARRNGSYRRYGCGCSPLGWIFSLFGLNVLIDRLLRRR